MGFFNQAYNFCIFENIFDLKISCYVFHQNYLFYQIEDEVRIGGRVFQTVHVTGVQTIVCLVNKSNKSDIRNRYQMSLRLEW